MVHPMIWCAVISCAAQFHTVCSMVVDVHYGGIVGAGGCVILTAYSRVPLALTALGTHCQQQSVLASVNTNDTSDCYWQGLLLLAALPGEKHPVS